MYKVKANKRCTFLFHSRLSIAVEPESQSSVSLRVFTTQARFEFCVSREGALLTFKRSLLIKSKAFFCFLRYPLNIVASSLNKRTEKFHVKFVSGQRKAINLFHNLVIFFTLIIIFC